MRMHTSREMMKNGSMNEDEAKAKGDKIALDALKDSINPLNKKRQSITLELDKKLRINRRCKSSSSNKNGRQ